MLARPSALARRAAYRTAAVAALAIGFSPSVMALKKEPATADNVSCNDIDQIHSMVINPRLFVTRLPFRQIATKPSSFLRRAALWVRLSQEAPAHGNVDDPLPENGAYDLNRLVR